MSESTKSQIYELKLAALSYSKLKDYKKAEKSIRKALDLNPESKNLKHELAKIFLTSKKYDKALQRLKALDSIKNKDILYKDIGLAYFGMGKLEKALDFSNKSLKQNQSYIEAHFLKGKTLRELEKYEEAIIEFDKILEENPKHRDSLYQKGKIQHILGNYRESLDLFDKVLAFRPRDNEVLAAKGKSHDELEEYKEASESINKSLLVEDEVIYNDRGVALTRLGYNHKAIDSYRRALASNPKYAICWFNLGKALFRVGDLNEALKAFNKDKKKVKKPKNVDIGPRIRLDDERCIMCSRCIRFMDEVADDPVLGFIDRGTHTTLTVHPGHRLDSNYSLNTADICPVGALTSNDFRFQMRVWFLKETKSIDVNCGTGCNTII